MDNSGIARILRDVADLLEIKGENPFRIRAYRSAADLVATSPEAVADLEEPQLLELPGIGRDLARKIRDIAATGSFEDHRRLLEEFPPTLLDLLRLHGVGPKTTALLYARLDIRTLDDLERAAREGRLRHQPGLGARKEQMILKALDERKRHAGRCLLPEAADMAAALIGALRAGAPEVEAIPVGSLRRGCETCGDLDILAVGGTPALMDVFTGSPRVARVLGRGDTKASVLLPGGLQADLRLVPFESRGAAMQYFTGSKAHNIVLRDRALRRGLKLNEYGLFRTVDNARVAGATEEEIYGALGLALIPPELRENRGEIAAAEARSLPRLIEVQDLKGDLHVHTTATDGRDDLGSMVDAARAAGLTYVAITDHSKALAMSNGLDEHRALDQARRIRALDARLDGFTVLAGIECDILPDGTLDLSEDCLAELDLVIASVHSQFGQSEAQMTERLLRAIESPVVDIIGHPTGRLILRREPYRLDLERIVAAAAHHRVALEINSQVDRLDLSDPHARLARDRGVKLAINTDAHARAAFGRLRWGVTIARRAWLEAGDVLNTQPIEALRASLRRHGRPQG